MPGRALLRLVPDALVLLSVDRRVAVVSGTNGKTTTTRLLASALQARWDVVSNSDGANLSSGVASSLLVARSRPQAVLVLEVDEVALSSVVEQTRPGLVVLLNLSRDQLDRTAEVRTHMMRWTEALHCVPTAVIVANADDAFVVTAVRGARPSGEGVIWVGAGKPYLEDSALCPACGNAWDTHARSWSCEGCGSRRPLTTWDLAGDRVLTVCGQGFPLDLGLPGRASASNAVMAAAAAHAWGVPIGAALAQMSFLQQVDGRYARYRVGGHDTQLVLAKNPSSWLEALDLIDGDGRTVVLVVNAGTPDGTDPNGLWDVPFEQLRGRKVYVSGERSADLAVRLRYADVTCTVEPDALAALMAAARECVVIANYSAFVSLRLQLRMSA